MASLLSKIQTLISADLNRLVDRSLDANDPAIFQQHIRELQKMQGQLTDQMVALRAQITAMRRKSDEQQALVVKQDLEVDQLLQTGLQADALAAQERLNQNRLVAGRAAEKVERLEEEYSKLAETKAQLDARILALRQSEPEVEGLASAKRAQRLADSAGQTLDDLSGAGDADVDRVVGSIRNRLAVAEAQLSELEQRSLSQGETPEVLKRKELEDQLEARKARLGLAEPPAPAMAPTVVPAAAPEAAPAPAPAASTMPDLALAPEPAPAPDPVSTPEPASEPDPVSAPEAPLSA
jgi:phage shock protein A